MKLKLKKKSFVSWISEIACIALIYASFLQYTGHIGKLASYIVMGSSVFLWLYIFFIERIKTKEFIFILILCIYAVIFFMLGKGSLVMIISYLPAALYLVHKMELKSKLWDVVPILIVVDLLIAWMNSPNKYILYEGVSRNYISIFTFYALAIYIVKCDKQEKKCNIVWIYVTWMISIWAVGRGGILASSVILILFIVQRSFDKQSDKGIIRFAKIVGLFIALICLVIVVVENLQHIQVTYFGRFFGTESSASSSDLSRKYMIVEYLKNSFASLEALFFGTDTNMITFVSDNLHNSYLQVHNKFGLIGILFIVFGSVRSIIYMIKLKKWDSLFIFLGFLVRGLTDWMFPAFPIDVFILYFVVLPNFSTKHLMLNKCK